MKSKLIKYSKPLLTACMALTIWLEFGITSILFFGEYEYPKDPEEK